MMEIISGVYKITNTVTGDSYIGSSKNIKKRWMQHKCQSTWTNNPNKQLYKDMMKYGVDKFELQILAEVEAEHLKETEQKFIETLKPTYNSNNAKGLNIDKQKKSKKKYQKSDKCKEYLKEYKKSDKYKEYEKSEKRKKYMKEYNKEYKKSDKYKEYEKSEKRKKAKNKYNNQLCSYNGELLTLCALRARFQKAGIPHPQIEAKKYLVL